MAGNALDPGYLYAGLVQRGLSPHIARAFVVNARDESGLNPGINEIAPLVPGSRGGFGLMQWTGPRRRALEAFAADRGARASDPDVQMDFLLTELRGPERRAWQRIQAADTAEAAAAAIVNDFLRPAESHRARRERAYRAGVTFNPEQAGRAYTMASDGRDAMGARANALAPQPMPESQMPRAEARTPQMPQLGTFIDPAAFMSAPSNALAPLAMDTTPYLTRRLRG